MLRSFRGITSQQFSQLKKELAELIPKKREGNLISTQNLLLSKKLMEKKLLPQSK